MPGWRPPPSIVVQRLGCQFGCQGPLVCRCISEPTASATSAEPDARALGRAVPLEEEHHDAFGRQVPTPSIGCDAGATNAMLAAASCLVGAEVVNEV